MSRECYARNGLGNSNRLITTDKPEFPDAETTLEAIFQDRRDRCVLERIVKSVRCTIAEALASIVVVVVVDPTPQTYCQQSPAPESCGSQQSLPPGGKERLHFVGIRPEVQARKGGW